MTKKIVFTMLALVLLGTASFAQFGLGARLGAGQNTSVLSDMRDKLRDSFTVTEVEHSFSYGLLGFDAFYETNKLFNLNEKHYFGLRLGYTNTDEESLRWIDGGISDNIVIKYYEIPLTVYYKLAPKTTKFNFSGGLGAAYGVASDGFDKAKKIYPFGLLGVEYRFAKLFGLGLDLKYNFAAKMKKYGIVYRDVSGVEAALTGRFYF